MRLHVVRTASRYTLQSSAVALRKTCEIFDDVSVTRAPPVSKERIGVATVSYDRAGFNAECWIGVRGLGKRSGTVPCGRPRWWSAMKRGIRVTFERARRSVAGEPVGAARHARRGSSAELPAQSLVDVEIRDARSVRTVSRFSVDRVPGDRARAFEGPGKLGRSIADTHELPLRVGYRLSTSWSHTGPEAGVALTL